jgi:hypothetical protein
MAAKTKLALLSDAEDVLRTASFKICLGIPRDRWHEQANEWGTGFLVSSGYALSAYHNFADRAGVAGDEPFRAHWNGLEFDLEWVREWSSETADIAVARARGKPPGMEELPVGYLDPALPMRDRRVHWAGRDLVLYGFPFRTWISPRRIGGQIGVRVDGHVDSTQPVVAVDLKTNQGRGEQISTVGERLSIRASRDEELGGISGAAVYDLELGCVVAVENMYHAGTGHVLATEMAQLWPLVKQTEFGRSLRHFAPHPPLAVKGSGRVDALPPRPDLLVGRDQAVRDLKARLFASGGAVQILTAVRGWPGVGKTTLARALAHDPEVLHHFADGVLWTALGQSPNPAQRLAEWVRRLGASPVSATDTGSLVLQASSILQNKRTLLIVDDVWESRDAVPFKVGGRDCAMLVTTRVTAVAEDLAPRAADVYLLGVLSEDDSLELLEELCPAVKRNFPEACVMLARALEGLPLALQVAGRLLNAEARRGLSAGALLGQIAAGARLLEQAAPADRVDLVSETTPTVAALLAMSTDLLDPQTRLGFARLGWFAAKPATFDLRAVKTAISLDDPIPVVGTLLDRGLLEWAEGGRYQMHALLVLHARSLLRRP